MKSMYAQNLLNCHEVIDLKRYEKELITIENFDFKLEIE